MFVRIVLAIIAVLALLESGALITGLVSDLKADPNTSDILIAALLTAATLGMILFTLCIIGANVLVELKAIRLALTRGQPRP